MVAPVPTAMPSTAAIIGFLLLTSDLQEDRPSFSACAGSCSVVAACRKSPTSSPAVNTPERPVRMRQRIAGLDCAELIASLMARNISSVSAFLFRPPHHNRAGGAFVGNNDVVGHVVPRQAAIHDFSPQLATVACSSTPDSSRTEIGTHSPFKAPAGTAGRPTGTWQSSPKRRVGCGTSTGRTACAGRARHRVPDDSELPADNPAC